LDVAASGKDFTAMAWIYPYYEGADGGDDGDGDIIGTKKAEDPGSGYRYWGWHFFHARQSESEAELRVQLMDYCTSGDTEQLTSTSTFTFEQWHHVAFVRNYGGTNYIYINSEEAGSAADGSLNASNRLGSSVAATKIGYVANYKFHGYLDELAVFNRALSADEIKQYYRAGRP